MNSHLIQQPLELSTIVITVAHLDIRKMKQKPIVTVSLSLIFYLWLLPYQLDMPSHVINSILKSSSDHFSED